MSEQKLDRLLVCARCYNDGTLATEALRDGWQLLTVTQQSRQPGKLTVVSLAICPACHPAFMRFIAGPQAVVLHTGQAVEENIR